MVVGFVLFACTAGREPIPRVPVSAELARFLTVPGESCAPASAVELGPADDLHRTLLADRAAALEVRRIALANAARGVGWRLLAAQGAVVAGLESAALEEARQIVAEAPDCSAGWLLTARLEEFAERPVAALEAYLRALPLPPAGERADALRPVVVRQLTQSIDDALASRRLGEAEAAFQALESLAPPAASLARAEAAMAGARGEPARELGALRRLRPSPQADELAAARWADLELELGDPGAGVRVLEEIARRHSGEPAWTERLARAKFSWRQSLLPEPVRAVAARPQLTRGDLAVVLYWVAPGVRHARGATSTIVTDVVDHPFREEIVRVVNLGLLRIDGVLRSFAPYRLALRGDALEAVLRARQLVPSPPGTASCIDAQVTLTRDVVCRHAVDCALVSDPLACLAGSPVSGAEVSAWLATLFAAQD